MEWKFVNRRATLFVANPFNITEDILPLYVSEFSKMNLLPSVNKGLGFKITPQGIEQEEVLSLNLKYLDNTLKVNFGPDRADIESTKAGETWETFRTTVDKIVNILSTNMNHRVVRLALCGSIIYSMDEDKSMQIYSKLAKIKNEQPVEWQLRKVLRTKLTTDDGTKSVIVNNVYQLTNTILIPDINTRKGVLLDMDVNTLVGTSADKILAVQGKFWTHASSVIDEAVVHYQSVFEDED